MNQKDKITDLQEKILFLELKQADEKMQLKDQFNLSYESLKPSNLIKNSLDEFIETTNFKEGIVDTTLSLAAGYLSKKIVFGSTHNPIKLIIGNLVQAGITSLVSRNTDEIKAVVMGIIANFKSNKSNPS